MQTLLLEIAKIAVPSLVALIVPLVTYLWLTRKMADYQTNLSKEIEDYKKDISKELYEFQTKYSLYHQQRAEVIQSIYSQINWIEKELLIIRATLISSTDKKNSEELLSRKEILNQKIRELSNYFVDKLILVEESDCKMIEGLINSIKNCSKKIFSKNSSESEELVEELVQKFPETKKILEDKFRKLLLPGLTIYHTQLEKKQ